MKLKIIQKQQQFLMCARILLFLLILIMLVEILVSKYSLEVTSYTVNLQDETSPSDFLHIIQLTDLHDATFGENNRKLISLVSSETPDLIFITGDLVNSHNYSDIIQAKDLISKLIKIAPVYISLGNQENALIDLGVDVVSAYEGAGATVLEFSYLDLEMKGKKYRIGGISGYCQPVAYALETHSENESEFLMDFQNTEATKLLLCHMPVCWINSYSLYDWDVDVVFSGHVHGGQIRISFVGGLWAPDFGWFPGKLNGVYATNPKDWNESRKKLIEFAKEMNYDTAYYENHNQYNPSYLVLSRGLGNTEWMPRFNNVPEIVVVDLIVTDTSQIK